MGKRPPSTFRDFPKDSQGLPQAVAEECPQGVTNIPQVFYAPFEGNQPRVPPEIGQDSPKDFAPISLKLHQGIAQEFPGFH